MSRSYIRIGAISLLSGFRGASASTAVCAWIKMRLAHPI
jgi:hypothetical protein